MNNKTLRERIAELEHEQWIAWSKTLVDDPLNEISPIRLDRWKKLWRPYAELTEAEKDQDREWADKVISIFDDQNLSLIALIEKEKKEISERER